MNEIGDVFMTIAKELKTYGDFVENFDASVNHFNFLKEQSGEKGRVTQFLNEVSLYIYVSLTFTYIYRIDSSEDRLWRTQTGSLRTALYPSHPNDRIRNAVRSDRQCHP